MAHSVIAVQLHVRYWVQPGSKRNPDERSDLRGQQTPAGRGVYHRAALRADPLAHAGYRLLSHGWGVEPSQESVRGPFLGEPEVDDATLKERV